MLFTKKVTVTKAQRGLVFRKGDFHRLVGPGEYTIWPRIKRETIELVSVLDPIFRHAAMPVIVESGALEGHAQVIRLEDYERAFVWVDGSWLGVLQPGVNVIWKALRDVRIEKFDIRPGPFEHANAAVLVRHPALSAYLDVFTVEENEAAVLFKDGRMKEQLAPGLHAFWKGGTKHTVRKLELRETNVDVSGQDIMTADHVTLRLNALVVARVADPVLCMQKTQDWVGAIYKEAQLILRGLVGTRTLESLLGEKETLGSELLAAVAPRGAELGVEVIKAGIKDLILPGEMRVLLNRVTEARKASEAALITRREETASMRHQANTAKLLENNPALLRLKELETLEKVAAHAKLVVATGDGKLADRIVNLI